MSADRQRKILQLREAWERATQRDKPKDAIVALEQLELLEPQEPKWPHRLGDIHRRLGQKAGAELAYARAMKVYEQTGFFARAVAMAKLVAEINPARADLLTELDGGTARALRRQSKPPPRFSIAGGSVPPPPPAIGPIAGKAAEDVPRVAAAPALMRAADARIDEVRFDDAPYEHSVEVDLAELGVLPPAAETFEETESPTAARLSMMSAAALFADVSPEASREVARAADLAQMDHGTSVYRRGERAGSIYVIVDGAVRLDVPGGDRLDLGEGEVFGEGALLDGADRDHSVTVSGALIALVIPKPRLDEVVRRHSEVGDVLFELLVRRLVTNLVQTAPLFTAFDLITRQEIAQMFEVRRAPVDTVLKETGKRSDGLYLLLAGKLEVQRDKEITPFRVGQTFGHESLLGQRPSGETIRAVKESVLLRLPAAKFGALIMQFPPILAQLADM